jgi:hypothetical protein
VALTCWEPFNRADERLSPRLRRVDLAAGLHQAGFTDVEVRDRPSWLARERALWEQAVALDPGDDPALRSFYDEGVRSLQWGALLRRVLAVATNPDNSCHSLAEASTWLPASSQSTVSPSRRSVTSSGEEPGRMARWYSISAEDGIQAPAASSSSTTAQWTALLTCPAVSKSTARSGQPLG